MLSKEAVVLRVGLGGRRRARQVDLWARSMLRLGLRPLTVSYLQREVRLRETQLQRDERLIMLDRRRLIRRGFEVGGKET